jgi:hypothetical protein
MEVSFSKVQVVIVQEHATPPHKRFMLLLDQLRDKLVGSFHNTMQTLKIWDNQNI